MNKYLKIIALFVLFFGAIYFFTPSIEEGRCRNCDDFLHMKFEGVVVKKFVDQSNHSYPLIWINEYKDSLEFKLNLVSDTTTFFEDIEIGDTISKALNSSWVYKKQNGVFIKYKSIDFGCNKKN